MFKYAGSYSQVFTVILKRSWTWSDLLSQTCTRQRLEGNKSSSVFVDGSSCIAAVAYKNFYSEVSLFSRSFPAFFPFFFPLFQM